MSNLTQLAERLREAAPLPPLLTPHTRREKGGGHSEEREGGAAFLACAAAAAAEALALPDAALNVERAATAATLAAEARGDFGMPLPAEEHQRYLAGLRGSAKQRPPSWVDQSARPSPGCWCSCCRGRRWWAPEVPSLDGTGPGAGWCCAWCHPPPPTCGQLIEVTT